MKTRDLSPLLKNLLIHAGESEDPLHTIRVACKRGRGILLLAKKSKEIELWLKTLREIRRNLEKFREDDVLLLSTRKLLEKNKNEIEHGPLRKIIPVEAKRTVKDSAQRKLKIHHAITELRSLSERKLKLTSSLDLKASYQRSYHLYKKCRVNDSEANLHEWRKLLIIFKSQLEAKLTYVSINKRHKRKKYLKAIADVDKLKGIIGTERDATALINVLKRHEREFPKTIHLIKAQRKKERKKIFICAAKFF